MGELKLNGLERAELDRKEIIKRINTFISSSVYLDFTSDYYVQPRDVYVDVVNNKNANKVITELSELVKISPVDNSYFSKVTVRQTGSSVTKFYVSYNKKVLFLDKYSKRITKDIATYLIKNFK